MSQDSDRLQLGPGKIQVIRDAPTLRDQFAMAAMMGLLADGTATRVAELAYDYADAMLAARKPHA